MHIHTMSFGGGAYTGHPDNNAGFSWSYQEGWSEEGLWYLRRELQLQISAAGRISQPIPCVMDDFGTLVQIQ